jgi:hypothetical protein
MTTAAEPHRDTHGIPPDVYNRRWLILAILNLSLVTIVIAVSSLNVAIPTIQRDLGASGTELQWIVDAYALVFAGLLLPAGALGDRFGRKGALEIGLFIFGGAALAASQATDPGQLIGLRTMMGVGAALIMPATLSILTNVFRDPRERGRAIAIWAGFSGLGVHTLLSIQNLFPRVYRNYLFAQVGVIDSASFKGVSEIEELKKQTISDLGKYVAFARRLGFRADSRFAVGTEAVEQVLGVCQAIRDEFPRSIFYLGQLIFENDRFYYRLLHNDTAFAIQRRLQFEGLQAIVLPIRVLESRRRLRRVS